MDISFEVTWRLNNEKRVRTTLLEFTSDALCWTTRSVMEAEYRKTRDPKLLQAFRMHIITPEVVSGPYEVKALNDAH